jgi:glycosyltransferase involved in cell wall biosynthesis
MFDAPPGDPDSRYMRLIWAGSFEPGFNRNVKLARLMELADIEVSVIRCSVWNGDRIGLVRREKWNAAIRLLSATPRLLWRLLRAPKPDAFLVTYPGWFDMPAVWLVSRLKRRPLLFDPFISLFDTIVADRALFNPASWVGRLVLLVDRVSLHLADVVIADTKPHLAFYDSLVPGVRDRGAVIPVGANDSVFRPECQGPIDGTTILFYGTFVPLQGVMTVIEAAHSLRNEDAWFVLIGDGQDRPHVEERIRSLSLTNIELVGILPLGELAERIRDAAVCLGIFGESEKASRVVPNKVYESTASCRPVITRASPAIDDAFNPGEVFTVPPGNPEALAGAIRELINDPERRNAIARSGRHRYATDFEESVIANAFAAVLSRLR